jgi:hypothetical protein
LGLFNGGAHDAGTRLEFNPHAFCIDSVLVPIPRKALHPYRSDVAAKTTKALEERY